MYRIVSLRSLNTEQHERLFQQVKGISKEQQTIMLSMSSPTLYKVYSLKRVRIALTARKTEVCRLVTSLQTIVNKTVCRGEQNLQTQMFSFVSSYHLGFHVVCNLQTLLSTLQTLLFTLQTMVYNLETLR